jgi:hypothetical protein
VFTVKRCREILGDFGKRLSDEQIKELRDQLSALADVAMTIFDEETPPGDSPEHTH